MISIVHKKQCYLFETDMVSFLPGADIVIVNKVDSDRDDLMQDFINLVTSFCVRLYGRRRTKRKTEKLIQELQDD